MLSAPISTAPAASSRWISGWSRVAGGSSRLIFEPARVGRPFTSNRFFTANGTPASGPSFLRFARAASIERARARARSASTSVNELSTGSRAVMRASASSTTVIAETRPLATAVAMSPALAQPLSKSGSGFEDRRGLGIVRQLLFADERGEPECDGEIGADFGLPRFVNWNAQRRSGGVDVGVEGIGTHDVRLHWRVRNRRK